MHAKNFLLIFMRYPELGRVKKRLASAVGPEKALETYGKLLRRTLGIACEFNRNNPGSKILLFHTPDDPADKLAEAFPGPWEFHVQRGDHLGARMENALYRAFAMGAEKAVLIGSDIADIERCDLEEGFRKTGRDAAVLGPASDGGFYLVGLERPCGAPFRFDEWGRGDVFGRSARALEASGLKILQVAQRNDVDREEDLRRIDCDYILRSSLSVVVPTLSGPEALASRMDRLRNALWPGDEIIVVRGADASPVRVEALSQGLRFVVSGRGRGVQQNTGAMLARGNILMFLHDDTAPPADFAYLVRRACSDPKTALGFFRLAFRPTNRSLDAIAAWANFRSTVFGMPYGDQAFFCRKEIFERAGGFGRRYLMEDVELVRKLRKLGKAVPLPEAVHSSPERYLKKGVLKASLQNHSNMLLYILGVDERTLYRRYYGSDWSCKE